MRGKAPKLFSYYGQGGYTDAKKRTLNSVKLPEKTRCFVCEKLKPTTAMFSEKQINDLRHGMACGQVPAAQASMKGWITCRDCTGIQNHEMQCVICDDFKGLDGFAKTQRRDPDNARCLQCVALVASERPHASHEHSDDDSDSDESQSNAYGSTTNDTDDLDSMSGVPLPDDLTADNLDVLNISTVNSTQPSASKASTAASIAGTGRGPSRAPTAGVDGWQRKNGKENFDRRQYTAYDAHGGAHVKAVSTSSSIGDDNESDTTLHTSRSPKKPEPKFAKVPAGPRMVHVPEYSGGRNVRYDNDSDEEDDDDDFFTM